jgi:hypothetical protein
MENERTDQPVRSVRTFFPSGHSRTGNANLLSYLVITQAKTLHDLAELFLKLVAFIADVSFKVSSLKLMVGKVFFDDNAASVA